MVRTFLAIRDVPPGFTQPGAGPDAAHLDSDGGRERRRRRRRALHEQIVRKLEAIGGVESVGVTSSVTMDGNSNNDPIWVEDFPRTDGPDPAAAPPQVHRRGYFETMGNPVDRRTRADVDRRARRGAGGDDQREPRARVPGASRPRRLASRIRRSPKSRVVRDRRRGRQRAPGRRDQAGADDGVLADADMATTSATARSFVQRSLAYAIRSSRLQSPGFLGEVQQAVWSVNPNLPLARVRTHAADLRRVDGADAVRAGDPRHRRVGDAAARPGRHLRRDRLHRVAAPARSRHPHGARRAERFGAADLRQPRPVADRRSAWRSAWSPPRR